MQFDKAIGEVVDAVSAAATELQSTAQIDFGHRRGNLAPIQRGCCGFEEMTQNVQTVASATEELSASISEISNQVSESTRIVAEAVNQADGTRREGEDNWRKPHKRSARW